MLDINEFLGYVKSQKFYDKQIVHIEDIPPRHAEFGALDIPVNNYLLDWLINKKIRLWKHQSEAINNILKGKNVIIATSTSSGKSLCYNLPVIDSILNNKDTTALYIFPRKALTQDQHTELLKIMQDVHLEKNQVGIYDGDTAKDRKRQIRNDANIVMTNPYALHRYIAHFNNLWYRFCSNLKYIIIDEIHLYKGIFGTNVAFLFRRLKRILDSFKINPIWILCSATIHNPKEFAEKLVGEQFKLVDDDGSPSGAKKVVLWDLPYDDLNNEYRSGNTESQYLFKCHLEKGIQTLMFTTTRKLAELQTIWAKSELPALRKFISTYRAGLNKADRRKIERGLKLKELIGVCSTNALELGIDIGTLEATITSGFPRNISSFRQQIGRSGRGEYVSVSTLIPHADPLDFFYIHNPKVLFGPIQEKLIINLKNREILKNQMRCAAFEKEISYNENRDFGIDDRQLFCDCLNELEREKYYDSGSNTTLSYLRRKQNNYFSNENYPTVKIGIDNLSEINYDVLIKNKIDGTYKPFTSDDEEHVYRDMHPGAIYLYNAEQYYVEEVDFEKKNVILTKTKINYFTVSVCDTEISRLEEIAQKVIGKKQNIKVNYGKVKIKQKVHSYNKLENITQKLIGNHDIDVPELKFNTRSLWFTIPNEFKEDLENKGYNFDGCIHGVVHALTHMAPILAQIDRHDIDGAYLEEDLEYNKPIIYIFDAFREGIGISERLYDKINELFSMAYKLIKKCPCTSKKGCPACVMVTNCPTSNDPLNKRGALNLLELLIGFSVSDLNVNVVSHLESNLTQSKDILAPKSKETIKYVEVSKEKEKGREKILILKLKNRKYYVGKSYNPKNYIRIIKNGNGPRWTQLHKFDSVHKILPEGDLKTITLETMEEFGWQNVRGYAWSQKTMKKPPRALRKGKLLNETSTEKFPETVYILKLENNKWLLGKCLNEYLTKRIKRYTGGEGSEWTKANKVVSIERFVEDGDLKELTLEYKKKYGRGNVRG